MTDDKYLPGTEEEQPALFPRSEHVFIPFIGETMNKIYAGIHFRKRSKHKNESREAVKTISLEPFTRPVSLTFIAILGKGQRSWDCSNYSYTAKLIEDGLVKAGILVDDSNKYVKRFTIEEPIVDRKHESGIWLHIEEIGEWSGDRWLNGKHPWTED